MGTATMPDSATTSPSRRGKGANITIAKGALAETLAAVLPIIANKATLPALSSVRIAADGAGVRFTTTNLDQTATRVAAAACESFDTAFLVPGKRLAEIVAQLPEGPVHLAPSSDSVRLRAGRANFKLNSLSAAEFPSDGRFTSKAHVAVSVAHLLALADRAAFAASTEESRPVLNGVLVEFTASALRVVATNGHRLALMEAAREAGEGTMPPVIVPPTVFDGVRRLFAPEELVTVAVDSETGPQMLVISSDRASLRTRVIEGPYPAYGQVIPTDMAREIVGTRRDILGALRRVMPLAQSDTARVKLTLAGGRLLLNVNTPDTGSAEDEAPIQYSGDTFTIGLNGKYLKEILDRLPEGELRWKFSTPERAMVLEPVDVGALTRILYVLMPLRLVDA